MKAKGQGILKHHFWGEYCATVGLMFETEEIAAQVMPKFQVKGAEPVHLGESNKKIVVCFVNSAQLTELEDILEKMGANRKKIASCAKSIDSGEPFSFEVDIDPNAGHPELFS